MTGSEAASGPAVQQQVDPRSLPPATGYSYLLPGGWMHLATHPGQPERRAAGVRKAVTRRVRREPRLAPHLARLDRLLLHECSVAAASGAERVSLLAEPVDGRVITASVTFAVERLAPPAGPVDAAGLAERLSTEHARTLGVDPAATLDLVALTQLAAVRRTWRGLAAPGSSQVRLPLVSRQWQLVVPWPGCPRIGLLTMSSPCAPLWPLLGRTFEACAQTFHWTWSALPRGRPQNPPH